MTISTQQPPLDPQAILKSLTLDDKILLTAGQDLWRTFSNNGQLPYAKLTDGPNGARGGGDFSDSVPAALYPSPSCLASTFDRDLAHEMGRGIAEDSLSKQCHVSLAPTVNITRDHRYGRAFENYGEDPTLSGCIGASWVLGCQSAGVGATPKHFACNEAEADRRFSNSLLSEAALREVYLEPFRRIFKEVARAHKEGTDGEKGKAFQGQPACVMTAYNEINGTSASENMYLIQDILRGDWGWKGMVMSDWFAIHDHALHTTDLEMPGPAIFRRVDYVKEKLAKGELTERDIEARAIRVLELLNKVAPLGFLKDPKDEKEESIIDEQREAIIRRIAAEGAVLLKNERQLLPIEPDKKELKKVALIGLPWKKPFQSGGGSSNLTPQKKVPAIESLREGLDAIPGGKDIELVYHYGTDVHQFPDEPKGAEQLPSGVKLEWFNSRRIEGKPFATTTIDTPSLSVSSPKPPGLSPNNFCIRATFDMVCKTAGKHTVGITSFGNTTLSIHSQASKKEAVLKGEYKGETDVFEYFLNEFKLGKTEVLPPCQAAEMLRVVIEYIPSEVDERIAANLFAGFKFGLDEEVDEEGQIEEAARLAKDADLAIILNPAVGPATETEGYDRPHLSCSPLQDQLMRRCKDVQRDTVVVNISGSAIEMPWSRHSGSMQEVEDDFLILNEPVDTIVQAWFGGQEAGVALVDILLGRGEAPASGRLCATWPLECKDQPAGAKDELFPGVDNGRSHPDVRYEEGRLVGYKWYESKSLEPAWWFGGGLGGYTTFESKLIGVEGTMEDQNSKISVKVEVKNTGSRSGKEAVQVYLAWPEDLLVEEDQPKKKLVAFQAVHLAPSESRTINLQVEQEDFSHWSQGAPLGFTSGTKGHWQVSPGQYRVILAKSANPLDEIDSKEVEVTNSWQWSGLGVI